MIKNRKLLITFFVIIFVLSACGSELTNEEIQAKMILANTELTSFFVETKISQKIVLESGNYTSTNKEMVLNGDVDLANKNGFLNVDVKTREDDGLSIREEEIATLYYVQGNTMFLELRNEFTDENVWLQEPLDEGLWQQQVQIGQIMEFLKEGSVEKVDEDEDFWVIKVKPSDTVLAQFIKRTYEEFVTQADIRTAIENYQLLVWVDPESFLIKKSRSDLKVVSTPQNSIALQEGEEATITLHTESEISELDKQVQLDIPEEALDAQSLESFKVEILEKSSKEIEEVNAELERIMKEREEMVHRIESKKPRTITKNYILGNQNSS